MRSAGVFDLGDAGAVRNGCGVSAVYDEILDFVFGIEDDGEDVGFFQAQEDAEGISCAREEFGLEDGGTIVVGVAIIILNGFEGLLQGGAGNKCYAGPVANKSAGDVGAVSRGAGCRMANDCLLALQELISAFALGLG